MGLLGAAETETLISHPRPMRKVKYPLSIVLDSFFCYAKRHVMSHSSVVCSILCSRGRGNERLVQGKFKERASTASRSHSASCQFADLFGARYLPPEQFGSTMAADINAPTCISPLCPEKPRRFLVNSRTLNFISRRVPASSARYSTSPVSSHNGCSIRVPGSLAWVRRRREGRRVVDARGE